MEQSLEPTQVTAGRWGRAWEASRVSQLGALFLMVGAPFLVLYFVMACTAYHGSLVAPLIAVWHGQASLFSQLPTISSQAIAIYVGWVAFQIVLAVGVPDILHHLLPSYRGGHRLGAVTPGGDRLPYQINGLQAWLISTLFFVLGAYLFGLFSPTIIYDHLGGLLLATTLMGNVIALFVYLKARWLPSHRNERKFSGSLIYDYYMGVELNPRIGRFDFKLFFNGRPGIVAWTLINISFAAKQYQMLGHVTNSMIIVNVLHLLYVAYFFWKETWYLHTIDICHDHFGWMLAWGDCAWLPFMYTLQGLYLVHNPVQLGGFYASLVLALGLGGFWIFASANNQKDRFRRSSGSAPIWGKNPAYIPCTYHAADGATRQSKLLVSGWWGVARHFNYTGDLMGSLAYCLACGFGHILPYFYFIYMVILLVHRCYRDEQRCQHKYGAGWEAYCRRVRYRLIPGIY
jgi:7-dehydrocholesterol reductase